MLVLMHVFSGTVHALPTIEPIETEPVVEQAVELPPVTETYEATAYIAGCYGCSGVTTAGHDARKSIYTAEGYRVIAVDPSVVPLYSIVSVTLSGGTTFKAQALDTGGAIDGHDIDLLVASESEAWEFGRQAVEIEIIRRGDGK